jgi:hypothetical protein
LFRPVFVHSGEISPKNGLHAAPQQKPSPKPGGGGGGVERAGPLRMLRARSCVAARAASHHAHARADAFTRHAGSLGLKREAGVSGRDRSNGEGPYAAVNDDT